MAIIYGTENELKQLDDKIDNLPSVEPIQLYKHKVTYTDSLSNTGIFIYYSTSNKTCETKTPHDWLINIYTAGIVTLCKSMTASRIFTIHALLAYPGEGTSKDVYYYWPEFNGERAYSGYKLTSITSDELVE